jgi:hypothetical protein
MHIPPFETAVGLQFSYKVSFYLNSYELFTIFCKRVLPKEGKFCRFKWRGKVATVHLMSIYLAIAVSKKKHVWIFNFLLCY